jgi:coproporphyrinogen III oxidase
VPAHISWFHGSSKRSCSALGIALPRFKEWCDELVSA